MNDSRGEMNVSGFVPYTRNGTKDTGRMDEHFGLVSHSSELPHGFTRGNVLVQHENLYAIDSC